MIPTERSEDQEKESLKLRVEQLKLKIADVNRALAELLESETYKKVADIEDCDRYFENLKSELESELQRLKGEAEDSIETEENDHLESDEIQISKDEPEASTKPNTNKSSVKVKKPSRSSSSGIQYKPCPECGAMHNAAYTRCAVCNDFDASNDPSW